MHELIHQEAARLFGLYGLRNVTMDDIARSLGISKKTIYIWYTDKNELVSTVYLPLLHATRRLCITRSQEAPDAIHEALDCWQELRLFLLRTQNGLMNDLQKNHPAIYNRYTSFCDNTIPQLFRMNLARGQREDLYRADWSDQLVTYHAKAAREMLHLLAQTEPKRAEWYTDEELVLHYLRGLSTPKGQTLIEEYQFQLSDTAI